MKKNNTIQRLTSHLVALFLGVILTFGGLRVLASQAEPAPSVLPPNSLAQASVSTTSPQSFVAQAVARTGPAVVQIDTEKVVTRRMDPFFDDPFFQQFFGNQVQAPPQERRIAGQGSGFIIDKSGIILTNAHVVSEADKVTVILKDGRSFEGQVQGTDEITDLAVVKINPQGQDLPVAPLGDSDAIQVGDWAIAVGNPVGLDNTVTLGIISTLKRSSGEVGIPDKRIDFIQTDAAINPGNSGGPLLNAQGEVIGINTAIRADAMGIGFAIPINKAKSIKNTLAAGQKVAHPYIGVQMINLTPEIAKQNNQDPNSPIVVPEVEGILVVRVIPNTPAQQAGVRVGDVIIKVNDQPIKDGGQLQNVVEDTGINQNIKLTVIRGEQTMNLNVRTAQLGS